MTVENVEVHLGRVYVAPDAHWPARTIGMARGREWRWRKWEMTGAPDGPKSTGRRLAVDVYRSACPESSGTGKAMTQPHGATSALER